MARSNGPVLVILAAIAVVGAGAAGWFLFNKSEPAVAEPVAEAPATPAPTKTQAPVEKPALDPNTPITAAPRDKTNDNDALPTREYYVDGKLVRDHRPEGSPEWKPPGSPRPQDRPRMKIESVNVITKAAKLAMRECVASIPPEERTTPDTKAKMEGTITVTVKNKTATITKSSIELRDVRGSASDVAKACIAEKVQQVTEGVDEVDLESYDITTSFTF